ncbi:MAG: hypothetical protein ACOC32_00455 [Nanoarchaeota archaeon]
MIFETLVGLAIIFLIFVLSALPLHLAVKTMGGKTNILKTVLVMILAGFLVSLLQGVVGAYGGILAFIVLIWVYREAFRLRWIKALLVWVLQSIFVILLVLLAAFFGLSYLGALFLV